MAADPSAQLRPIHFPRGASLEKLEKPTNEWSARGRLASSREGLALVCVHPSAVLESA